MFNRTVAPLLIIYSLMAVSPVMARQATVDRILVVVNDEIITESDLKQTMGPIVARMKATMPEALIDEKLNQMSRKLLTQMVDDRLVISAAKEMNIEVNESEIDEMIADMRRNFPSQDVFHNVLREQGMSMKLLRERFHDDIIKRRAIDFNVRSRIGVSPGEIRDYYEAHTDKFEGVKEVRVRQILIRAGDLRTDDDAEAVAHSLVYQISQGANMAELAEEYSDGSDAKTGGDMGWVKQGQFMRRLDGPIFKLKAGEITEPIKTQLGYHIFRVEDVKEPQPNDFENVRGDVRSILYKMKTDELLKEWLQQLRDNAYISYKV